MASSGLQPGLDEGLQLDGVGGKFPDALGELLHSHLVLIVLVAEGSLVQTHLLQVCGLSYIQDNNTQWT